MLSVRKKAKFGERGWTDGFQSPEAGDKLPETVNLTSLKGLKLWGDLNSAEIACSWRARKGELLCPKFLLFFAMIHAIEETKSEPWGPSWWSSGGEPALQCRGTQVHP